MSFASVALSINTIISLIFVFFFCHSCYITDWLQKFHFTIVINKASEDTSIIDHLNFYIIIDYYVLSMYSHITE